MRLYLAGAIEHASRWENKSVLNGCNVLQSFAYYKPGDEQYYPLCKNILLDSGAFSIISNKKIKRDFDPLEYVRSYGKFIKDNNIKYFFELDIESVCCFEVYKNCLHELQDITGKEPIYVFHKWRGLDYYKELVKQKDFIALGDVSVRSGSRKLYGYFPWFIQEAHKNNCRVHGLAFTTFRDLQYMNFDSVDSTSWLNGSKYANPCRFDGHIIRRYKMVRKDNVEIPTATTFEKHDFLEWKKLSQYFEQFEPIW